MPLPLTFDEKVRQAIQEIPPAITSLDHCLVALIVFAKLERSDLYERILKIVCGSN
jgi:hypothetical protein